MKVVTTHTIDPALWDDFVRRHPLATIYHHRLWQDVILKTYGYQPLYHILLEDSAIFKAAVSSVFVKSRLTGNRIVSYPFSDTCDPLVRNSAELGLLLDAMEESRAKVGAQFVEFRFAKAHRFMNNQRWCPEYSTHLLDLDREPAALFRTFHKSCIQRAIKKARQEGLDIVTGKTEEDLRTFYRLNLMTHKRHGVPIQPYRFFRNLWNTLSPSNMLTLLLGRYHDKVVAGIILLWFKDIAYYKFGASDEKFLRSRVNQLLMWKAIRMAQQRGCRTFDFGRANCTNQGLARYKTRWGTRNMSLHYLNVPNVRKSGVLMESSSRHTILKKIITRMPVLVNRMSGQLLYKHFA